MYVNIEHNIDSWDGGFEIDEVIRGFAKRLNMEESSYSSYNPQHLYLQYDNVTKAQFSTLKRRLKNSKKLQDIELEVTADDFN